MNSTHYEDFCDRMKQYRKKLGYNQTEIGKKLGISQNDYSKRENGIIMVSYNNMKSLQELGMDIDVLVCGVKPNVNTQDLDEIISECHDDSRKDIIMRIIAESIMYYRNIDIRRGSEVTEADELLSFVIKEWDDFSMLEYVRNVTHYSQDVMSKMLGVTRKKYRKYEKEQLYPDADILVQMYNIYNCRPSMYLNIYDRRYYAIQNIWMEVKQEQKDRVIRMVYAIKDIL